MLLSQPLDGLRAIFTFPRYLNKRGWMLFFAYLLLATIAASGVAALAMWAKPALRQAILDYFFPAHWQWAGKLIWAQIIGSEGSRILANFIMVGCMSVLSTVCAVIKEMLSRNIERSQPLLAEPPQIWPFWRQLLEEIKFALLYLLTYNVIFWINYFPYPSTRILATVLSYVALFVFFNITFLCPLFLRHRIGYGRMIRTFITRPLPSLSFAALWCAPSLIASQLVQGQRLSVMVVVLLLTQLIVVAPAATGGTYLAARLLPQAQSLKATPWLLRLIGWLGLIAVLAGSFYVFFRVADSLHKKSQILKCDYQVDTSTLKLEPGLSQIAVALIVNEVVSANLSFDLEIKNRTEVDLMVERSRLEIANSGKPFGTVLLQPIDVPAGQSRRQTLSLTIQIVRSRLLDLKDLFSSAWSFALWIAITDSWEFPIYLRAGG